MNGKQYKLKGIDSSIAITLISTMGYAGQLTGPAMLGFIAFHHLLNAALTLVAVLLCIVVICYSFKKEKTI